MSAIENLLSAHHFHLERLLAEAVQAAGHGDWPAYRTRLLALRKTLLEHMDYEEEQLFPVLEQRGLALPELAALREEHAQFRRQLDALQAAVPQHDPEGCIGELELLAAFQRAHHDREATACYNRPEAGVLPPPPGLSAGPAALDLRGLQPPEPIVRIFDALERAPHAPLRAILPHEPLPLYGLLRERGFSCTGRQRADGGFEILIEAS